jgi:hypothetical protein
VTDSTEPLVAVPGELDVEDRVIGPLTFRQLGYLAAAASGAAITRLSWPHLPGAAAGLLLATLGLLGSLLRPGGRPLDAWLLPIARYARAAATEHTCRVRRQAGAGGDAASPQAGAGGDAASPHASAGRATIDQAETVATLALARPMGLVPRALAPALTLLIVGIVIATPSPWRHSPPRTPWTVPSAPASNEPLSAVPTATPSTSLPPSMEPLRTAPAAPVVTAPDPTLPPELDPSVGWWLRWWEACLANPIC